MRFIQETGFTIKTGKNRAFQQWLVANHVKLAASYPKGTSLVGVFVAVFSSEKGAGDVRLVEQLDSYAALDRTAALAKDTDSDFSKLISEFISYMDSGPAVAWSSVLLKDMVDATIFDT
jgi:hypothetical protein